VVELLLDAGAEVDACGEDGITALWNAAGPSPTPDTVRLLLAAGADPNATDAGCGFSPLDRAAQYCKPEIAVLLIDAGADVLYQRDDGFTLLMTAAEASCESVARLLLAAGVDPSLTSAGRTASDLARARGYDALADFLAQHTST
jgi:ankyrin repeat protein